MQPASRSLRRSRRAARPSPPRGSDSVPSTGRTSSVRATTDEEKLTMPPLRSRTVTHGRNMAGARALLRAAGVAREDFGKPIVADRQLLHPVRPRPHAPRAGRPRSSPTRSTPPAASPREFNTIAVDDGIAMGHGGMLYSLPSRELIADSRRVHGQRALRRRAGLHLQLRQDHAGHAERRAAAEHPDRVRLRRADGGRHRDARRRHRAQAR